MQALWLRASAAAVAACLAVGNQAAPRDHSERAYFQKQNPCPANGLHRGPCPGWQIDHIKPLCAGGKDRVRNMQWLTVAEHKAKTRKDVRRCRLRRP